MGVSGQRHTSAALLPQGKGPPVPIVQEAGWGPRVGLDTEVWGKILCPCRGSNPDRPVVQPIVRHYTAWANPAPSYLYSGRKIPASFGKSKGEAWWRRDCLSMYSITENIYYSQPSPVALLLQPEPATHRIIQGKHCVLTPYVLSSCGLPLPPTYLLVTVNEARSYFASTILVKKTRWNSTRNYLFRKFIPCLLSYFLVCTYICCTFFL
jgi:hypothetical protein